MGIVEKMQHYNTAMLAKREKEIEEVLTGKKILITSGTGFDGYEIMEQMGLICDEIIVPNGLLGLMSHGTFSTVSSISEARQQSIRKLEEKARGLGANAVIGVDLDIQVFPSIGAMVSANGTAVRVGFSDQIISTFTKAIERHEQIQSEYGTKPMQGVADMLDGAFENYTPEEFVEFYRKSTDKKEVIYKLVASNTDPISAADIRAQFGDGVELLEIATYLSRLVEEGKLKKDAESKKYSKI